MKSLKCLKCDNAHDLVSYRRGHFVLYQLPPTSRPAAFLQQASPWTGNRSFSIFVALALPTFWLWLHPASCAVERIQACSVSAAGLAMDRTSSRICCKTMSLECIIHRLGFSLASLRLHLCFCRTLGFNYSGFT